MLIVVGWALLHLSSHSRIQPEGTTSIWNVILTTEWKSGKTGGNMHLKPLLRTGICHISAYISLTLASHMAKLTFGQGSYLTTGRYCKAHDIRWGYIYISFLHGRRHKWLGTKIQVITPQKKIMTLRRKDEERWGEAGGASCLLNSRDCPRTSQVRVIFSTKVRG